MGVEKLTDTTKHLVLVPVVVLFDLGSASRFAHDDLWIHETKM